MPAKKRKNGKLAAQKKTAKGPPLWKRFFHFLWLPPVRRLILAFIFLGLIWWFWTDITRGVVTAWKNTLALFGAGIAIIATFLGLFLWIIISGKFSLLWRYWNFWLGGIALAFATWGLMAFFAPGTGLISQTTLGGTFGESIITDSDTVGVLRVAGLALLSIILMAPGWIWRALKAIFTGLAGRLRKASQPQPKVTSEPSPARIVFGGKEETAQAKATPKIKEVPQTPVLAPPQATPAPPTETWEPGKRQPIVTTSGWQLPPISILDKPTESELSQTEIERRGQMILDALDSYGVEAKLVQINVGPTVTQYGLEPGWDRKYKEVKEKDKDGNAKVRLEEISKTRVKVDRISSLANDLSLALAAPSIRIEAPVPGKSIVGVEVPNTSLGTVGLRGVMETTAFQKIYTKSKLALALGKGAGGETVVADLARMPHLLIAGATGSGKTVSLNAMICCLLMSNTPDDVKFIMIDPKRVELVTFKSIPHLIDTVVVETDKAVMSLHWLLREMDDRYKKFARVGARNIEGYNKDKQPAEPLPYIIVVVDELADLMMAAFDEVERSLCRLAQLARATGIHLIVATQRPSVDVITGLIKANFPTRISFALTSQIDSRTILDSPGAEKLLGRGDMLYMPTDASKPKRLQGCFVSDAEMERLVYFWGSQHRPVETPIKFEDAAPPVTKDTDDELLDAAIKLAEEHKDISASFLQRRLRIGYPRAARLMDQLEQEGYGKGSTQAEPKYPNTDSR